MEPQPPPRPTKFKYAAKAFLRRGKKVDAFAYELLRAEYHNLRHEYMSSPAYQEYKRKHKEWKAAQGKGT